MYLRDNITKEEVSCKCGCGLSTISPATLDIIQDIRVHFNKQVVIHSACRCTVHNKSIGGKKHSKHLPDNQGICRAIDFHVEDENLRDVYNYIEDKYSSSLGLGIYNTFIHLDDDVSGNRRWDNRTL